MATPKDDLEDEVDAPMLCRKIRALGTPCSSDVRQNAAGAFLDPKIGDWRFSFLPTALSGLDNLVEEATIKIDNVPSSLSPTTTHAA